MASDLIAYFGYGSLVNPATLRTSYVAAIPARLGGWKRHWQARPEPPAMSDGGLEQLRWREALDRAGHQGVSQNDIALLSVHRNPEHAIHGMLIIDRVEALPALDDRERLYSRQVIDFSQLELFGDASLIGEIAPEHLFIYEGPAMPPCNSLLLQSYLDAVMAGFHAAHGEDGVRQFLATTDGFGRQVLRDRDAPIYPRAVAIEPAHAAFFDRLLEEAGAMFR